MEYDNNNIYVCKAETLQFLSPGLHLGGTGKKIKFNSKHENNRDTLLLFRYVVFFFFFFFFFFLFFFPLLKQNTVIVYRQFRNIHFNSLKDMIKTRKNVSHIYDTYWKCTRRIIVKWGETELSFLDNALPLKSGRVKVLVFFASSRRPLSFYEVSKKTKTWIVLELYATDESVKDGRAHGRTYGRWPLSYPSPRLSKHLFQ